MPPFHDVGLFLREIDVMKYPAKQAAMQDQKRMVAPSAINVL